MAEEQNNIPIAALELKKVALHNDLEFLSGFHPYKSV
jgi:hypothetical protein